MNFFTWLIRVIRNEYERRIRAASEITEYGIHHHHGPDQAHNGHAAPLHDVEVEETGGSQTEDESFEIQNVPPGTRLTHSSEAQTDSELKQ